MKLFEIAKPKINWNTKTEKEQIDLVNSNGYDILLIHNPSEAVQLAAVTREGPAIMYIENPFESVQLAAVKQNGYTINYIKNPTQKVLLTALKNLNFIKLQKAYETFVKEYFADNTLLMKKWLRYGEAIREQ
jgi:hypothetical protein